MCILFNSICLSLFNYSDRDNLTFYNKVLNWINNTFTIVFLFEASMKILAMGFIIHKYSYLRDGWNFVDFIIVISG